MNYYKQFAEMLGLELEQEFVITDVDGNIKDELIYKVTEDGLLCKNTILANWSKSPSGRIVRLLNGDYKVVTKPWKPKKGEKYFYYEKAFRQTVYKIWIDENYDLLLWKLGNCFRTKEEAEAKGKEIMEKIQKEYEEA